MAKQAKNHTFDTWTDKDWDRYNEGRRDFIKERLDKINREEPLKESAAYKRLNQVKPKWGPGLKKVKPKWGPGS